MKYQMIHQMRPAIDPYQQLFGLNDEAMAFHLAASAMFLRRLGPVCCSVSFPKR